MDSLLLTSRQISGTPSILAVVCDGVGSMVDGAYASMESVRLLNEWFLRMEGAEWAGLRLRDTILSINTIITAYAAGKGMKTATTLSALLLIGRQYYIVHAGDSRVYSVESSGLLPLTIDDVTETGRLTSVIGRRHNPEIYYREGVANNAAFLLCSDGLNKRVDDKTLFMNIDIGNRKTLRKSLSTLSSLAIQRGESDNISIALVKIV